jgi:hypothetical protein
MGILYITVQDVSNQQLLAGASVQGTVNVTENGWFGSGAGSQPFSGNTNASGVFATGQMAVTGFDNGAVDWEVSGTVSATGYQSTPFTTAFSNVGGDQNYTVSLTPLAGTGGTGPGGLGSGSIDLMAYLPYIILAIVVIVIVILMVKYRSKIAAFGKKVGAKVKAGAK